MGPSPTYGMPAPPAAPQGGPNGAMGSMSPATSPPAVKPREKTILKIIDPESGQELTPEMINPGRHSQHALQVSFLLIPCRGCGHGFHLFES